MCCRMATLTVRWPVQSLRTLRFSRLTFGPSRGLWIGRPHFVKTYREQENEYALSVLQHMQAHPVTHNHLEFLQGTMDKSNEVCREFLNATAEAERLTLTIEDPRFNSLSQGLVAQAASLSDNQLLIVLGALARWPQTESTWTPNFCSVWHALDDTCRARCDIWDDGQLLHVAHLWFALNLSRITQFNTALIRQLGERISSLSKPVLLQLLFFINVQRQVPPSLMHDIEDALLKIMAQLTVDELSIAAFAFFKTQTAVRSEALLLAVIAKMETGLDSDGMHELSLVALAKLLRYSAMAHFSKLYTNLQRRLVPFVGKYQASTLTHLVLLGTLQMACDHRFLEAVATHISGKLRDVLRLKELEKVLFCLVTFAPTRPSCQEFVRQTVDVLRSSRSQDEVLSHPHCLVSILLYMAYVEVFPEDLINKCLDESFLKKIQEISKVNMFRDIYALGCSVMLECPSYGGAHLSKELKMELFKKFSPKSPGPNTFQGRLLADIRDHLSAVLGGEQYSYICGILPHFQQTDILFILEENGIAKPISESLMKNLPKGIIMKPTANEKWCVIVIGGRSFYDREHREPTGVSLMKMRQLRKMGFVVIEVPWFIYSNLHRSQKDHFIRQKIYSK